MKNGFFDVQAAMLYEAAPSVDGTWLASQVSAGGLMHGLPVQFEVIGGSTDDHIMIKGGGMHAILRIQAEPLPKENFALSLQSPLIPLKKFNFAGAIAAHRAAIVISVGDGETPMPSDARKKAAEAGAGAPASTEHKLTLLHLLMQSVAVAAPPLMVDFVPSSMLLCGDELSFYSDLGLPLPILFHPMPEAVEEAGEKRLDMHAVHAEKLIGAPLKIEAIPRETPTALAINLLGTLITNKRSGKLPLNDGDVLRESGGLSLHIRHEQAPDPSMPAQIVARIVLPDHAAEPAGPVETQPEPDPEFEKRIARIMAKDKELCAAAEPVTPCRPNVRPVRQKVNHHGMFDSIRDVFLKRIPLRFAAVLLVASGAALKLFPLDAGGADARYVEVDTSGTPAAMAARDTE